MEGSKEKKKSKKLIIAIVIILLICIIAAIVVAIIINKEDDNESKKEKSVGTEWGDAYYLYLVDNIDDEIAKALPDGEELKNIEVGFIETEDENPVMLMQVNGDDTTAFTVCYLADDEVESTDYIYSKDDTSFKSVDYLYNKENKDYNWYVHTENEQNKNYISVNDYVSNSTNFMEFPKEEQTSKENLTISKFDEKFVEIEDVELDTNEISADAKKDEIFETMEKINKDYKPSKDLVTEEIETKVNEKVSEIDKIKEELSKLPSKEEALKIGQELYDYGAWPGEYDYNTNKNYIGKSKTEEDYNNSKGFKEVYLGYPFGDNSDVEDYFTNKRISELSVDKDPEPYGLEKSDGKWYFLHAPVGGDPTYVGTIVSVKDITANKITYTATSYWSADMLNGDTSDLMNLKGTEYVNAIKNRYKCTTEDKEFVIVKEDGKWKIDTQTVIY